MKHRHQSGLELPFSLQRLRAAASNTQGGPKSKPLPNYQKSCVKSY